MTNDTIQGIGKTINATVKVILVLFALLLIASHFLFPPITTPPLTKDQKNQHVTRTWVEELDRAIQNFKNSEHCRLPINLQELTQANKNGSRFLSDPHSGLDLHEVPKDPWGGDYFYRVLGADSKYEVGSYGADGKPGGSGVDADISKIAAQASWK